jgi:hypothetical protein
VTRAHLRLLVRSILLETVSDNHGVFVGTLADVTWSPEKNAIPFSGNPFVGGSPAFEAWLNDGVTTRRFRKNLHVGTPDEESFLMTVDDYVKEGEWVIIPTLWSDPQYRHVYQVESIYGGPSQVRGTPPVGAFSLALCRLVRTVEGGLPTRLPDVGLAFLKRVASKTKDSLAARKNAEEFMDSWTPPKTRASGRRDAPQSDAPAVPSREPERRVIRRVGGVAAPPEPRAPRQMSGDEVRDMLGLRRLRESGEIPPSGMGARVRRLGRTSTLKGVMVSLNVQLRGLYIDALDAHESGDRETYKQIMVQIGEVEQQLADLQTQHDAAETDT